MSEKVKHFLSMSPTSASPRQIYFHFRFIFLVLAVSEIIDAARCSRYICLKSRIEVHNLNISRLSRKSKGLLYFT